MFTDAMLSEYLPSRRKDFLAAAIGHRLIEVERLFLLDRAGFAENPRFSASDYFSHNSGPTQLRFERGVTHVLDVWGEQLSVVVLPDLLEEDGYWSDAGERLYRLSEDAYAPPDLKGSLGRVCSDVRIWTLQEEIESQEAREVAVSYALSGDLELFYAIYLHGDLDSDYLMLGRDLPRDKAATCYSIARGEYSDPTA